MHRFPTFYRFVVILILYSLSLSLAYEHPLYGQSATDPVPPDAVAAPPGEGDPAIRAHPVLAHHFYLPLIQRGDRALTEGESATEALVAREDETADQVADELAAEALVEAAAVSQIPPNSPECLTQFAPLVTTAEPTWRFVLNFNVWLSNNRPVGCVLLNRSNELQALAALRVPCKRVGPVTPVAVSPSPEPSQANFVGGYFTCTINLQSAINALDALDQDGTPIHFAAEYSYPHFTVLSRGALVATSGSTLYANPLIAYQPTGKKKPDLAFFAPLHPTLSTQAALISYYRSRLLNQTTYRTNGDFAQCAFSLFTPTPPQIWGITRDPETNRIRHTITGQNALCTFPQQPPLRFATNGGAFVIGYSALQPAQRLSGTLDEVLIDPPGSTKPPT